MNRNNKRLFKRTPFKSDIFLVNEFGQPFLIVESSDCSLSGIFLHSSLPFKNRTILLLKFFIEPEVSIECSAQVVRLVSPRRGPGRLVLGKRGSGIGLRFINLQPNQVFLLEQFLQRR